MQTFLFNWLPALSLLIGLIIQCDFMLKDPDSIELWLTLQQGGIARPFLGECIGSRSSNNRVRNSDRALVVGGVFGSEVDYGFRLGWIDIGDFREADPQVAQGFYRNHCILDCRHWRFVHGVRAIGYRNLGNFRGFRDCRGHCLAQRNIGRIHRAFDARRAAFPNWRLGDGSSKPEGNPYCRAGD